MDFITKMKVAMELLHEACKMNEELANCSKCPFVEYCDALEGAGFGTPAEDEFIE